MSAELTRTISLTPSGAPDDLRTNASGKHVFGGCITAIVTPFSKGQLDVAALERHIDWQIENGVSGIVAVGTTGESATLSVEEHVEVIKLSVRFASGRVPMIAGVGSNSTAEAIDLSKRAQDVGATGLLHVTPYYNKPTQEGLFRHYEAIAQATPLPILLYNVPSRTSCDLLPDTVAKLADLPTIVGIKDATGNCSRYSELILRVGERISVLSGDDATAFPMYALGGHGVVSVVSNVAPKQMSNMWNYATRGNYLEARRIHQDLFALCNLLFAETSPAPVKAALAHMGRMKAEVKLPMVEATSKLMAQLGAEIRRLELA